MAAKQEPKEVAPTYYLHAGKVYKTESNPLYDGVTEMHGIVLKTEEPRFRWKGSKIPFDTWATIAAFMRWSQETHKDEAMVTLFYNTETHEWGVWAFAQRGAGLSVNYIADHPTVAADRARFGRNWIQFGSVHHHCNISAFASGTDKSDEEKKEGVHFTIGKLNEPVTEIHCRQVFGEFAQDVHPLVWIDHPAWIKAIPAYIQADTTGHAIKCVTGATFPDVWKERIIKDAPFVHPGHVNGPTGREPWTTRNPNAATNGVTAATSGAPSDYYRGQCLKVMKVLDSHNWNFEEAYDLVCRGYDPDTPPMDEEARAFRWAMIKAIEEEADIKLLFAQSILRDLHRQKLQARELAARKQPEQTNLALVDDRTDDEKIRQAYGCD